MEDLEVQQKSNDRLKEEKSKKSRAREKNGARLKEEKEQKVGREKRTVPD